MISMRLHYIKITRQILLSLCFELKVTLLPKYVFIC